ncbi:MAG: diguanylate cyclase [Treponema sp.]|nr:diguanylate cyclase [Treponema sp.]MCL2237943.1 diguanylate cyclase [Treponema sp.]
MAAENIDFESIQKQELFSNLDNNEIEFVASFCGVINLEKNKPLFGSGEKAERFYILTGGEIRVIKKNENGHEEQMAHFTKGDTIGDFDFARGAKYDACAEAAEDSVLIAFPAPEYTIVDLLKKIPNTICTILLNAIIMMTGRIKSTRRLILENMPWVQELHRRAYEDPGTGLWKQTLIKDEIAGVLNDPSALIMLKPDRFKILVDSRGHSAGDEAMIRIALILKNIIRITGHGWALRFKSNEVGLIFNDCHYEQAEKIAEIVSQMICALEPVPPHGNDPEFKFSATVAWAVWPGDDHDWENLLAGTYSLLLDTWKAEGNKITHYAKAEKS